MKRIGQLNLLIVALTVHFMFSGQPISASTCGTLFSAPKKGERPFDPATIDPDTLIPKARLQILERSGIFNFLRQGEDPRLRKTVTAGEARHILDELWQRVETVRPETVSLIQEIKLGLFSRVEKGEPRFDEQQATHLQALRTAIKELRELSVSNPTKEMEITSLNRLAFAVSLLMAHVNGKTRPSLSGNYTSPDYAPIKDFAVPDSALANGFYRAVYPTFYSFHPESVLFLISRGMLPWQVGERLQSIDGGPLQEPYAVSMHDLAFHLPLVISSNISTSTKESTAVFESLWKGYVNKPGQPVWQRELKIHILFELLFNEPRSFSVAGITRGPETYLQSKSKLDNLTAALSNKDNFASKVLQEQKVTREQLVEAMRELQAWLRENP